MAVLQRNKSTIFGLQTDLNTLQSNIDSEATARINGDNAIITGAGLAAGGAYPTISGTNYLNSSTSLVNADSLLDTQVKANADAIVSASGAATAVQNEVDAMQTASGGIYSASGTYNAATLDALGNISASTDLANALSQLDSAITTNATTASNIQTEVNAIETASGGIFDTDGSYLAATLDALGNISASTSLSNAIGQLDTAISANATSASNLQTEVDLIETASGGIFSTTGAFDGTGLNALGNITGSTSLLNAISQLDSAISTNASSASNLQTELDATQLGAGLASDGTFTAHSGTNFIDAATSLRGTDVILDTALKAEETARIAADALKLDLAGGTMTGSINMGGFTISSLGTPVSANDATNKAYVDSLVSAGTVWEDPVTDPDVVGVAATVPGSPVESTTWIAYNDGAGTGFPNTWGTLSVSEYDIVTYNGVDWIKVASLVAGTRVVISAEHGSVDEAGSLFAGGIRENDIIEYVAGNPALAASWSFPHHGGYQVLDFTVAKAAGDSTGLANDATVYALDVTAVGGSTANILVTGSAAQTFATLVTEINADLDSTFGAGIVVAELKPEGHIHITHTAGTRILISKTSVGGTDITTVLTNYSAIKAGNVNGTTVLVSDPDSLHYSDQITYSELGNDWTLIGGPSSVLAGIGLVKNGQVIDVNLGAGITELPSDEVGIDVHATGGLITTVDGTTPSTASAAQLAVKLDGTTLSVSGTGLRVSSTTIQTITDVQTEVDAIETASGNIFGSDGSYTAATLDALGNVSASTSLANALSQLDTAITANATSASNLQTEVDLIETASGGIFSTTGAFDGTGLDALGNITGSTSLLNAIGQLDTAISNNATSISNVQTEVDNIETASGGIFSATGVFSGTGLDALGNISASTSLLNAISQLDSAITTNATNISTNVTSIGNVQSELDTTQASAGLETNGTYTAHSGSNYIDGGANLKAVDLLLDTALKALADNTYTKAQVDALVNSGGATFITETLTVGTVGGGTSNQITLSQTPKNGIQSIFNFQTVRHTDVNDVSYDIPLVATGNPLVFTLSPDTSGQFDGLDVVIQYAYTPA